MGSSLPPSCLTTRQNSRGAMIIWRDSVGGVESTMSNMALSGQSVCEIWLHCIDLLFQALFEDFWTSQAWNPPDPSVRVEIELWWRVYNHHLAPECPVPGSQLARLSPHILAAPNYIILMVKSSQALCRVLNLRCTEAQMQRMVFINPSSYKLDLHSYDFALQCTSSDWSYL